MCPHHLVRGRRRDEGTGAEGQGRVSAVCDGRSERDTQELLAQYVPAFDPSFLGLRGSQREVESLAKLFKVFYQKNPSRSGAYTMDHTAGSFVFDKQGRIRLLVSYGAGAAVFAHDLSQLLG